MCSSSDFDGYRRGYQAQLQRLFCPDEFPERYNFGVGHEHGLGWPCGCGQSAPTCAPTCARSPPYNPPRELAQLAHLPLRLVRLVRLLWSWRSWRSWRSWCPGVLAALVGHSPAHAVFAVFGSVIEYLQPPSPLALIDNGLRGRAVNL